MEQEGPGGRLRRLQSKVDILLSSRMQKTKFKRRRKQKGGMMGKGLRVMGNLFKKSRKKETKEAAVAEREEDEGAEEKKRRKRRRRKRRRKKKNRRTVVTLAVLLKKQGMTRLQNHDTGGDVMNTFLLKILPEGVIQLRSSPRIISVGRFSGTVPPRVPGHSIQCVSFPLQLQIVSLFKRMLNCST